MQDLLRSNVARAQIKLMYRKAGKEVADGLLKKIGAFLNIYDIVSLVVNTAASPSSGGVSLTAKGVERDPVAVIETSVISAPAPVRVRFDGSGSIKGNFPIETYAWTFEDGTQASGPEVARTFYQPGSHTVKLIVTDQDGKTSRETRTVYVYTPVWTYTPQTLLTAQFEVGSEVSPYHDSQVGRILAEIGWSRQKPQKRASERDEAAIEKWRSEHWEELKKSRDGE